uniref:Uncharacterized protein n=1 Tax=Glossina austeni TaxID=7395 RepID=A0A1A9V8P2_GLOAU
MDDIFIVMEMRLVSWLEGPATLHSTLVNCAGPPVGKLANALRERVMVVRAFNAANKPSGSCVMPLPSTLNSSMFLQFFRLDVRCTQSLTAGGITVIEDLLKSKRLMPTKVLRTVTTIIHVADAVIIITVMGLDLLTTTIHQSTQKKFQLVLIDTIRKEKLMDGHPPISDDCMMNAFFLRLAIVHKLRRYRHCSKSYGELSHHTYSLQRLFSDVLRTLE